MPISHWLGADCGRVTLVLFRTRRRDECSRLKEGERRRVRKSRQKEAAGAADAGLMQPSFRPKARFDSRAICRYYVRHNGKRTESRC